LLYGIRGTARPCRAWHRPCGCDGSRLLKGGPSAPPRADRRRDAGAELRERPEQVAAAVAVETGAATPAPFDITAGDLIDRGIGDPPALRAGRARAVA
jgi:hypothetical protein